MDGTSNPNWQYNNGGTEISAKYKSPTNLLDPLFTNPSLGKASVNVELALTAMSEIYPVFVSKPEGASSEITGQFI